MGQIIVANWNIEKNGQSSDPEKQTKVSEFIAQCCENSFHIIFLCEVHSARVDDYLGFLRSVYGENYRVESLPGGHSNAYVLLARKDLNSEMSYDGLRGLNRSMFLCHVGGSIALGLAHFKSGQTGLTKSQIEEGAAFLESFTNNTGLWAISGDMNWDYNNLGGLTMPAGSHANTCWTDQTQKSGGILDWCAAGRGVSIVPVDGPSFFHPTLQTMDGPDHRPVAFALNYKS